MTITAKIAAIANFGQFGAFGTDSGQGSGLACATSSSDIREEPMYGKRPTISLQSVSVRVQPLPYRHVRLPGSAATRAEQQRLPAPVRLLRRATFHLRTWWQQQRL